MYNSGASASIFHVEHVNYNNAPQRPAGEPPGACATLPSVCGVPPIPGKRRSSALAGQLAGAWCERILLRRLFRFREEVNG